MMMAQAALCNDNFMASPNKKIATNDLQILRMVAHLHRKRCGNGFSLFLTLIISKCPLQTLLLRRVFDVLFHIMIYVYKRP